MSARSVERRESVVDFTVFLRTGRSIMSVVMRTRDMARNELQVGEMLRREREARGYSVRRLASDAGVDHSVVLRIEAGFHVAPKPETLQRLARVLGVDVQDLYTAAGYVEQKGLPTFRPYLRAKYGHLPAADRRQLNDIFARVEAEYAEKRERRSNKKRKPEERKGGRHAD